MADIYSILSANYKATVPITKTPYVNVDPTKFQGTWEGKYSDNTKFSVTVSAVAGFRAQVRYQDTLGVKYQQVLIKDDSFKVGNSKFTLQKNGHAQVKTVVVDPASGASTLNTAYATRD
jgi:hypothetical protein